MMDKVFRISGLIKWLYYAVQRLARGGQGLHLFFHFRIFFQGWSVVRL